MLASEVSALICKFEDSRKVFLGESISVTFYREGYCAIAEHAARFASGIQGFLELGGFALREAQRLKFLTVSIFKRATSCK